MAGMTGWNRSIRGQYVAERGARHAAILMYHRISESVPPKPEERIYSITPALFGSHLEALSERGRDIVSLKSIHRRDYGHESFVLTFDDGFDSDIREAVPILRSFGASAAFFISPALVGSAGYMSWSDIGCLVDAGMEVGTHGLDHTPLDLLSHREAEQHLFDAKQTMERQLGMKIEFTSLPGGGGGSKVVRAAYEMGYRLVLGSRPLLHVDSPHCGELPRFALRRGPGSAIEGFRTLVDLDRSLLRRNRYRYRLTSVARKVLGRPAYEVLTRCALARIIRRKAPTSSQGWDGIIDA